MDTDAFAQVSTARAGNCHLLQLRCDGSQIWSTSILSEILIQKYQPRLVVIGTSFLDYTEGREFQIDERFKENDWLEYQTGNSPWAAG